MAAHPYRRTSSNRLLVGAGVIVCCLLLFLALPRFIASLYALYPEALFQRMVQSSRHQPEEAYIKSIAALDKALVWFETGDYRKMQAFFELARPVDAPDKRTQHLQQGRQATIRGLMLQPVDPFVWFRLASIDASLGAAPQQVMQALRLSIYAGPVEPELLLPRMSLSYRYMSYWDDEMRDLMKAQIRSAWEFQKKLALKKALAEFAAAHFNIIPLFREALISSPDEWNQFQQNFEKLTQKNNRTAPKIN